MWNLSGCLPMSVYRTCSRLWVARQVIILQDHGWATYSAKEESCPKSRSPFGINYERVSFHVVRKNRTSCTFLRAIEPFESLVEIGEDRLRLHAFQQRYFAFVALPIFRL